MESQKNIQANILITIDNVIMHRFVAKEKSQYTSGTLKIAKIDSAHDSSVYFMNINSFYYTLSKSASFTKIRYDDTVSYVFSHFQNGLSSLTFPIDQNIIHNFEEIIQNISVLNQFDIAIRDNEFERKINENCPGIEKQPIFCPDKIKSTINLAGKKLEGGLKTAGGYLSSGINIVGQFIESKIVEPQNKSQVSPAIKQKWQALKNGTNSIINVSRQMYLKYLSPIVNTGVGYGKKLDTIIENSDIGSLKYVRSLAYTSGNAFCHAFKGLSDGTNKVITQLGCQSRKIITKKLGEDYIKTFLPESSENKQNQSTPVSMMKQRQSSQQSNRLIENCENKKND